MVPVSLTRAGCPAVRPGKPDSVESFGRGMVWVGLGLAAFGGLLWAVGRAFPALKPGRLPGDLVFERQGMTVYVPLASMVVLSVVLSLVAWLAGRAR